MLPAQSEDDEIKHMSLWLETSREPSARKVVLPSADVNAARWTAAWTVAIGWRVTGYMVVDTAHS